MNPSTDTDSTELPLFDPDLDATYTLEIVAKLSGVPSDTILHYQEQGLISPSAAFDDETLRSLRRIDHLRTHFQMNLSSLKLMLSLMDELEHLRSHLRSRR